MLQTKNYTKIITTAKLARELGVDFIQFKVPCGMGKDAFSKPVIKEIYSQLKKSEDYSSKDFRIIKMQKKEEGKKELMGDMPKPTFNKCWAHTLNGVIGADGNVYPCVHYYYNQNKISGNPLGNIYKQNFKDIWTSNKRKEITSQINPRVDCAFCNRYDNRINKFLNFVYENQKD